MLNKRINKENIAGRAAEATTEGLDHPGLEGLFQRYRSALPDHDPGRDFMPELWQRIEARQSQTNFFGRMSRVLVTAALAASLAVGILLSASNYQATAYFNGTYIEALSAQQTADLDPYHPDHLLELEQQ